MNSVEASDASSQEEDLVNTKEICKKPEKLVGTKEGPSKEEEEEEEEEVKENTAQGPSDYLQEMKKEIEEMKEKFVSQNQIIMDVNNEVAGVQKNCKEAEEKYRKMIKQFAETLKKDMVSVKQDIVVAIEAKGNGVASEHEKRIKQGFDALEGRLRLAITSCFAKMSPLYNRYEDE